MVIVGASKIHTTNGIQQLALTAIQSWYFEITEFNWDSLDEIKKRFPNCELCGNSQINFFIHKKTYRISTELNFEMGIMLIKGISRYGQ